MKMPAELSPSLLAPCGMDCLACYVYLRKKKACLGCRGEDLAKPDHCRQCKIKDCAASQGLKFCHQCPTYPCPPVRRMDKSYRQRYQVSLIEMAERRKEVGVKQFLMEERRKWNCACGGVISLHDQVCSECGLPLA